MIFTPLILMIFGIVFAITLPLRLLPDASLPANILSTIQTIGGYIHPLNEIFPISTIFATFSLLLSIEGAIVAYRIIMWSIKRLPTQS